MRNLVAFILLCVTTTSALHANPLTGKKPIRHNSASVKLPLVHRNKLSTSSRRNDNYRSHYNAQTKRDAGRVASLIRNRRATSVAGLREDLHTIGSMYVASIKVGSQLKSQDMVIDTGSDLVWVKYQYQWQCERCFDPSESESLSWAPCGTPLCDHDIPNSGCDAGRCTYRYSYADGTVINGIMASKSITIGNTTVHNLTMGCANVITSDFESLHADGLLGLGRGSLSLASQSGELLGGAFSYCLGSPDGWLEFGRSAFPANSTTWAPLISNMYNPSLYYIELSDLGVGGEQLNMPEDTFRLNPKTGEGGAIIDTGSTYTLLPTPAYAALHDMFKAKTTKLLSGTAPGGVNLGPCYNIRNETC